MAQPQPMYQAPPKRHSGAVIAVVIVVVLVVFALIGYFLLSKSGKIVVTVSSTHLLSDVEFRVFLDGQLKHSGTLSPAQYVQYTFSLTWFTDSCQTHQVSADSTGGLLGPQDDSESVKLCSGTVEQVSLGI